MRILSGLAAVSLVAACQPLPPVRQQPAMTLYFDCVGDRGVAVSAHRAQSAPDQPENSLAAIRATGRAIPNAILEIDAALTRDGRLVLMHDETLERTSTGRGRVADLSFAEVRRARLRATDGTVTDEPPPTLEEALAEAGRVGAIASIDLKPASEAETMRLARAVVDEVRRADAGRRTILITYSAETARAVAALAPEMMISAGVQEVADLEGLDPRQVLAWTGTRRPNPELWAALNDRNVEAQFGTLGAEGRRWDDRYAEDGSVSEYRDLVAQGVTVIATDAPLAVKGVLEAEIAAAATCRR